MNTDPRDLFLMSRDALASNYVRALAASCDNTKALLLLNADQRTWRVCEQRRTFRDMMLGTADDQD